MANILDDLDIDEKKLLRALQGDVEEISVAIEPPARRLGEQVVGEGELRAGLKDASADTPTLRSREFEDSHIPGNYKMEPSRPQFGKIPATEESVTNEVEAKRQAEMKEIEGILAGLEKKQTEQRGRNLRSRTQALTLRAGDAISSGMSGLPKDNIPIPEKYDVAEAEEKKIRLGDSLRKTEDSWAAKELQRILTKEVADNRNATDLKKTGMTEKGKADRQEDAQAHDKEKIRHLEAGRDRRAKMNVAAMLGRAALGINASAGANRVDQRAYEEEAEQAKRQLKEYVWERPVDGHTQNKATDLVMAKGRAKFLAEKALDILQDDPHSMIFWGSDARAVLKAAIMSVAQANVKFEGNGVANGRDIENSLRQMGDLESAEAFVSGNGIVALEQFLTNLDSQTDAALRDVGARRRRPGEAYKQLPDPKTHGGGGSGRAGVNPNVLGGLTDWAKTGGEGPPPVFNEPNKDAPGMIPTMPGNPNQPRRKVIKWNNGNPVTTWE